MIAARKAALRQACHQIRDGLPPEVRHAKSRQACERLEAWYRSRGQTRQSQGLLMCYVAIRSELNTHPLLYALLAAGLSVCVPVVQTEPEPDLIPCRLDRPSALETLSPGRFGVPEPPEPMRVAVPREHLAVVVVPGLAFDRDGNRLGYGGGFFDRFLAGFSHGLRPVCVGLAFAEQIVEQVPVTTDDVRMDLVVTDQELITVSGVTM